jgi:hypothetical protein
MRSPQPAADANGAIHPFSVALQHLSSADGDEELYKATARVLHCASRECQTAARAGLRHLSLDRYFDIVANPSDRLPWYERPWLDLGGP